MAPALESLGDQETGAATVHELLLTEIHGRPGYPDTGHAVTMAPPGTPDDEATSPPVKNRDGRFPGTSVTGSGAGHLFRSALPATGSSAQCPGHRDTAPSVGIPRDSGSLCVLNQEECELGIEAMFARSEELKSLSG